MILTGDGVRGWVGIEGGTIAAISTRKPRAKPLATDGVIMPGLLDLHGHPEFNVFAPWEPPKTYINRYSWRATETYGVLVREPQDGLQDPLPAGTELRYAEIRAWSAASPRSRAPASRPRVAESLVRNVDGMVFGDTGPAR